jgi:hypothetical protein
MQEGKLNEAIAIFERQEAWGGTGFLGFAYAKMGRRAEAEQIAAKYPDRFWQAAMIHAALGDKDHALDLLRQMAETRHPMFGMYLTYPEFDSLHDDPRFTQLREKLMQPLSR